MSDSTDWEVLFHYTSLMNFERIIRNGYIALCDIIKSNDPAEGYFAFDALKHAYRELYQEEVIDRNTYDKLHRVYIDFSEGEKAFGRLQHAILSLSFCEPDLSLALWRSYGDNGKGICFSVSKEQLMRIGKEKDFKFAQIEYLSEKSMNKKAKEFWLENCKKTEDEIVKQVAEFYLNGYFIKRFENHYEREWRLAYTGLFFENYCLFPKSVPKEIDAFMRDNDMVTYYKLPIKPNQLIQQIYVGPQCKVTYNELTMFLSKHEVKHYGVLRDSVVMR